LSIYKLFIIGRTSDVVQIAVGFDMLPVAKALFNGFFEPCNLSFERYSLLFGFEGDEQAR